ncbi:hypothetical protein [Streptomyces sp. DH37]|uniref:hypothetical protein n=1 Tax=Streptomyces sp. DH37 TaxID=3040122 RepID=UPI0024411A12|nr:hypothetical protein [Streptomyces sp. DH37]MDG9704074.1 hypothetical protein [Streptomyces sp. DH37]
MGKDYGAYAAKNLSENLYERMIGVWYSLEAKGEVPSSAEEFANVVTHTVFDALSSGLGLLNEQTGKHPDDPRAVKD